MKAFEKKIKRAKARDERVFAATARCSRASPDCCAALLLCCAVLCCAVLCCAVLCCAVLCCAVLCCAVLCHGPAPLRARRRSHFLGSADSAQRIRKPTPHLSPALAGADGTLTVGTFCGRGS